MIKKIQKYLFLEYLFLKMNLLTMMQFNISYFLSIVYEVAELTVSVICYKIIFQYIDSITGWPQEAIIFLTIYAYFVDVTCTMFFIGMVSIPDYIRTGVLDLYLLKPVNKQFFLTLRRPNAIQLLGFLGSIIYFIIFILTNNILLSNAIMFVAAMICSIVCMYSVLLLIVSASFWVVKIGDLWNALYTINGMGGKPLEIYPKVVRGFLIIIIPSAIIITFPPGILFGVYEGGIYISILVTVFFFLLSRYAFRKGIKRYDSACG